MTENRLSWSIEKQTGTLKGTEENKIITALIKISSCMKEVDLTLSVNYPNKEAILLYRKEDRGMRITEAIKNAENFNSELSL